MGLRFNQDLIELNLVKLLRSIATIAGDKSQDLGDNSEYLIS